MGKLPGSLVMAAGLGMCTAITTSATVGTGPQELNPKYKGKYKNQIQAANKEPGKGGTGEDEPRPSV